MSAKTVELGNSNDLDYSSKSQNPFSTNKVAEKNDFRIGVPRPNLTNEWVTTFYSIPADENPLNAASGVDDIEQRGKIHFLVGQPALNYNPFGPPVTRSIVVAENQSLVFPILNSMADNIAWDFGYEELYEFPIDELGILNSVRMDTVSDVLLQVDGHTRITDGNKDQYRVASKHPYTLDLPAEDDIFGYRSLYPEEQYPGWLERPYTQGVQDGIWVELERLSIGIHTIHFEGTFNFNQIEVEDYDNSGATGDTPLEAVLGYIRDFFPTTSLNVTYNVEVLSRPEFNAQLAAW